MGVFSRFRDIIAANINSMLDKAEDPEKMVRLIIQEIEDTLVELRSSCAGTMAESKRIDRRLQETNQQIQQWEGRAALAVEKGREDLAREAVLEKLRLVNNSLAIEQELFRCQDTANEYLDEIRQLEEKLAGVREKQRSLVRRHTHAQQAKRTQQDLRKADTAAALARFEQFENRVERIEAEADIMAMTQTTSLEQQFSALEKDQDVESELARLRAEVAARKAGASS